jgi:hypothetical protein
MQKAGIGKLLWCAEHKEKKPLQLGAASFVLVLFFVLLLRQLPWIHQGCESK